MGLVYRCPSCDGSMVLEPFHRGREVPCPHCRGRSQVPAGLEFESVVAATEQDAASGRNLLALAVAMTLIPLFPVTGFIWWYASGRIHRAREQEREVDPVLRLARGVAAAGCCLGLLLVFLWATRKF